MNDCYDALEWVAGQPWCRGRIGMVGGSGNGVGPHAAFLSGHSNLVVAAPGNSSATAWYWTYDNRVRRWLYQWMKHRGMGRYAHGLDGQTPLEKDKVYHLHIDLWSTAAVFDKGHRIGVYVTSSSAFTDEKNGKFYEVYEVHPNTFAPADSFDHSPVANQTIHCGGRLASRIILPEVK